MKLSEIGEIISEDDIRKLETKLNLKFPTEYKKFLLQNNGGMPEEEVEFSFIEIDVTTRKSFEQGSDIQYFYNTDEMIESYENLVCEELINKTYIPIACDSFGNEILLCLNPNENYGCVFFSDHESTNLDDSFWSVSKIADSFNKFIDMLKPMEF